MEYKNVEEGVSKLSILSSVQIEHERWRRKNFPIQESWHSLVGMMEELGELSHTHLKQVQNVRRDKDFDEEARDALGDILIFMIGYANSRGYSLEEILKETWNRVKQRDWIKFPLNGKTK